MLARMERSKGTNNGFGARNRISKNQEKCYFESFSFMHSIAKFGRICLISATGNHAGTLWVRKATVLFFCRNFSLFTSEKYVTSERLPLPSCCARIDLIFWPKLLLSIFWQKEKKINEPNFTLRLFFYLFVFVFYKHAEKGAETKVLFCVQNLLVHPLFKTRLHFLWDWVRIKTQ